MDPQHGPLTQPQSRCPVRDPAVSLTTRKPHHYPTSTLALVRCMMMVCIGAHWFACTWAIIAGFADSPLDTWMGNFDYCWAADTEKGYVCVEPWDMYAATLYFAMMTITSIGYGDFTPQRTEEYIVSLSRVVAFRDRDNFGSRERKLKR